MSALTNYRNHREHLVILQLLLAAGMANATTVQGWQSQPNNRGTFDIIKTCTGTIFLLCWSSVCPNIPNSTKCFRVKFTAKLKLFLLALPGPDFIFMTASGQLKTAWGAKIASQQEGCTTWGLRHCFFSNMDGLHLGFRDRRIAGLPSFPVDCEQLRYLVQHKYITFPEISEEDIDDRNKADNFARAITVVQALWFTTDVFGRISQGLFVTTLELTTLALVPLTTCCSICWWYKPMDISRPIVVCVDADISAILREANAPNKFFGPTPKSFLNRQKWIMSQFFSYYNQILRNMKLLSSPKTKPTEAIHFPTVEFPETDLKWEISLLPGNTGIWRYLHDRVEFHVSYHL